MVSTGKILKRSWQILWDYKVLWIFGFLLAITAGGGGNGGGNNGSQYRFQQPNGGSNFDFGRGGPVMESLGRWFEQNVTPLLTNPEQHVRTFILIGILIFLLVVVLSVLAALIRYPSEVAVIRMVDEYEQTGTKVSFRQGWKLGWSRRAFRLWLVDLILSLPVILFVLVMLGVGLLFFASVPQNPTSSLTALGTSLLCIIPLVFVFIGLMIFLGLLRNLFARDIALGEMSIGDAFRHGWMLFKQNWKSVGLIWLIMVGIGILYALASIFAFFILIPVYVILMIPAALVAAIPGLLAFAVASLFTTSPLTWIIAALFALPFFFTLVFAPLIFLQGWYLLYESNVWTLTYRELMLGGQPETQPAGDAPFVSG